MLFLVQHRLGLKVLSDVCVAEAYSSEHVVMLLMPNLVGALQSIESLPAEEVSSQPRFWRGFRPGKMLELTASPDGRWLAVSFGTVVKIYSIMLIMSSNSSRDMASAVVSSISLVSLMCLCCTSVLPEVFAYHLNH